MNAARKAHPRDDARDYLAVAQELLEVGKESAHQSRWRAAGILAIHAAIAASDAVCIRWMGERASGPNHADAAEVLGVSGAPGARERPRNLHRSCG